MAYSFTFQTVNDIRCQAQLSHSLGELITHKFNPRKIMLITDKGLMALGKLTPALQSLQSLGIEVILYDEVQADPPDALILAASELAVDVDVVVGLGGGSSMDTAKLVAVLATRQQALSDMYGVDQVRSERKPLVLLPTTAGTGSEVTPISVVTTGEFTKSAVVSATLYADLVVLDASLLLGLPASITAETGIDAMVHAIEAYTSKIKKIPLSDNLARQALTLLSEALPLAVKQPHNLHYRELCLLGAMLAGQAFANAPVAAVHALAYPLGGIFHLAHGLTNALMLPHVLRYNLDAAQTEYAELARHLLAEYPTDEAGQARSFLRFMADLAVTVGLNKKLRDVGVDQPSLPTLAEEAMKQTRLLQNNPLPIGYADALRLYQQAW